MESTVQLTIRLLGIPQIFINNRPFTDLQRAKSHALFYYLVAAEQQVSRTELVHLLWPDSNPSAARRNLRNHLTTIRPYFDAFLTSTSEGIAFHRTPDCDIDLDEFTALRLTPGGFTTHSAAQLAEIRRTVNLYRGDFLAGFRVVHTDLFEDWVEKKREALFTQFSHHLFYLSQAETHQGNFTQALEDVDRLLVVVPWHEGGHRLKLQILAEQGKRWAALEHYETLTNILHQELDVSPSEETERLMTRIRQGLVKPTQPPLQAQTDIAMPTIQQIPPTPDASSQASTTGASTTGASTTGASTAEASTGLAIHVSPVPLTPLLGHGALLAEACATLKNPAHRLVTLMGMGGVGKTHMALTLGQMLADEFEHGVCFVPLAGIVESALAESEIANRFVLEVATALQLPLGGSDEVMTQMNSYLRRRRMLLILDNFEHVWSARTQLTTLLKNAGDCTVLVTSRIRLQLSSETVLKVNPLAVPTWDEVEDALHTTQDMTQTTDQAGGRYAALQLFIDRARRYNPDFRLYRENFDDIIQVCHLTGGLPLALEMVAAWTEHFTLSEIADQLQQDHRTLLQGVTSDLTPHTSIDALFEHSWQHLNESIKHSLLRTAHFTAAFDRNAVKAIADVSVLELKQLTDTSLLQRQGVGRYTLHPLVQRFVQCKWHERYGAHSSESERFWQAYCAYYLAFLSKRVEQIDSEDGPLMMAEMRQEQDHIALSWQQALNRNDADLIGATLDAFTRFYMRNGAYEQLSIVHSRLADRLEQGQLMTPTDVRYTPLAFHIGLLKIENDIAMNRLQDALTRSTDLQSMLGQPIPPCHLVQYYTTFAYLLLNNGSRTEAKDYFDRVAELLSDEIPRYNHTYYHLYMGQYWFLQGDLVRCEHHMRLSLDCCRMDGNRWDESIIIRVMAFFLHTVLEQKQVRSYLYQALALSQQTKNRYGEAQALNAFIALTGYRDQALRIHQIQKALEVYEDIGNENSVYAAMRNLSWEYLSLGQYTAAQQLQATLWANQEKTTELSVQYSVLLNESILHRVQGEITEAVEIAQTLIAMNPRVRQSYCATGFLTLGYAYLEQERYINANDAFQDGIHHIQTHQYPNSEVYLHTGLAEVAYRQQDYGTALREVELILTMLDEDGNQRETTEPLRPYWVCYQVLKAVDDPRAKDVLQRGYYFLMKWVDTLDNDEWRHSFLADVWVNRMIVEEWKG